MDKIAVSPTDMQNVLAAAQILQVIDFGQFDGHIECAHGLIQMLEEMNYGQDSGQSDGHTECASSYTDTTGN